MSIIKRMAAEILKEKFDAMTQRNDHTGAAIMLAVTFGTEDEKADLEAIEQRQNKVGYIASGDLTVRDQISNKYHRLLKRLIETP